MFFTRSLSISIAAFLFASAAALAAEKRVVAYVPNWIDLAKFAEVIDCAKVTHLNVAFENPVNEAGDLSFNSKNEALLAKAHPAGVKVFVSIGGGSASGDKALLARYASLLGMEQRARFARQLADYVAARGFDGLDVDLEGPSITGDYGAFIAELAGVLKPRGKLLTAALSRGYGGERMPDATLAHFDWVNIMAYDGAGPWEPKAPGQHSSMEFAKGNVRYWLEHGLPKEKAVLGVPFYGYGFGAAFRKRDYPYSEIVAKFPGAENRDEAGEKVWFNGIPTIRAKTRYVVEQRLGGVMIWSLDYDVQGERSLLSAIHDELRR